MGLILGVSKCRSRDFSMRLILGVSQCLSMELSMGLILGLSCFRGLTKYDLQNINPALLAMIRLAFASNGVQQKQSGSKAVPWKRPLIYTCVLCKSFSC
jgi:hypothetical protein